MFYHKNIFIPIKKVFYQTNSFIQQNTQHNVLYKKYDFYQQIFLYQSTIFFTKKLFSYQNNMFFQMQMLQLLDIIAHFEIEKQNVQNSQPQKEM